MFTLLNMTYISYKNCLPRSYMKYYSYSFHKVVLLIAHWNISSSTEKHNTLKKNNCLESPQECDYCSMEIIIILSWLPEAEEWWNWSTDSYLYLQVWRRLYGACLAESVTRWRQVGKVVWGVYKQNGSHQVQCSTVPKVDRGNEVFCFPVDDGKWYFLLLYWSSMLE